MSHERLRALTDDALLHRNVAVNLAAWVLPAVAALVSIPVLAQGLGAARFGVLTFAWAVIGTGSLTDFGFGRTLTRLVAVRLARGLDHEVADLVWAASWALFALSVVPAIVGWLVAPTVVAHVMNVPPELRGETVGTLRLIAATFPFIPQGVLLRGVLEAAQEFPLSARLRVPMTVVAYAGPILALPFGGDVRLAVGVIVVARLLYWLAHLVVLGRVVPGLGRPQRPRRAAMQELFHVGRWITAPAIIAPVLHSADRLAVASAFPIAASAWYGTAAEVASKQMLFASALQPVLYPALAATYEPAPRRAVALMWRATWVTMLVLFGSAFVLAAFARPLLRLWMRGAYAPQIAAYLPWLAIAIFVNGLAQVPTAMLQGAVDAKRTGVLMVAELPVFLALLVLFGYLWGLTGIAVATLARMLIDAVGQWWLMADRFPASRGVVRRTTLLGLPALAILVAAALMGAA